MLTRGRLAIAAVTLAAFAAGAVTSAAAVAAPGWYDCVKVQKVGKSFAGAYTDRHCSTASATNTGHYELQPITGTVGFSEGRATPTGPKKQGGFSATWRIKGSGRELSLPCPYGAISGELVPPDGVAHVEIELGRCENGQSEMRSPGERGDEFRPVHIGPLSGELGYLNRSAGEIGLDLQNESEPGGPVAVPGTVWTVPGEGEYTGRRSIFGSMIAVLGSASGTSRHVSLTLPVSTYLGMVPERKISESITVPPYEPLTNPPSLEGGEEDVLLTEISQGETEAAFPLGLEASIDVKTAHEVVVAG